MGGAEPSDELVHDARVALRRLRTALRQFGPLMALAAGDGRAKSVAVRPLSAALRVIGGVRDADVMLETLNAIAGDDEVVHCAGDDEQAALQELRDKLARERASHLKRVADPERTRELVGAIKAVREWAERPVFESTLAHWPADLAAPQLLLEKAR